MTTIGIIGAGHIGSALARTALDHGYDVVIANSRGPETLQDLIGRLGGGASAATPDDAAARGDLAVVTIPFRAYRDVPVQPLAGKVVIDTNNYYPQRDGRFPELDARLATSAGLLQSHLPASRVVKAFNTIRAAEILSDAKAAGTPGRRALPLAGDDQAAVATVAALIDEFGFDPVVAGTLVESWRIEPGSPAYGVPLTAQPLEAALRAASR